MKGTSCERTKKKMKKMKKKCAHIHPNADLECQRNREYMDEVNIKSE